MSLGSLLRNEGDFGQLWASWAHFGMASAHFGVAVGHFEVISEPLWGTFGVTLGSFWCYFAHFGVTLELLWGHFRYVRVTLELR